MQTLYTARAHNQGGRDGRATAADGHPDLVIKPPQELGGPADLPEATNPEELFALGFGACFLSALSLVARQQKISARRLKRKVGTRQQIIIDEVGPTVAKGRSKADAPEIDGSVYVSSRRPLRVGEIVTARIERADEYDLHGTVAGF